MSQYILMHNIHYTFTAQDGDDILYSIYHEMRCIEVESFESTPELESISSFSPIFRWFPHPMLVLVSKPSTAQSVQMKLTVLFSGFVLQTTATDSGLGHHGLSVRHVTPEQHSYMWTFPDRRSVNWNNMSRQQHH